MRVCTLKGMSTHASTHPYFHRQDLKRKTTNFIPYIETRGKATKSMDVSKGFIYLKEG